MHAAAPPECRCGRRLTQDFRGDRERPELVDLDICKSMSEIDPAADESVPV